MGVASGVVWVSVGSVDAEGEFDGFMSGVKVCDLGVRSKLVGLGVWGVEGVRVGEFFSGDIRYGWRTACGRG